ncbi:flagellar cap protein FliD [Clostridioides difficile]|nr:flagellar cap protein FliD [Clostridioides difficile]
MASISPVRVTGLSGNFDMDGIIEASLIRDQEKIDKAKQQNQMVKWKQELYREVIKDSKNLYDKYLQMDSPNSLTSRNSYSSMGIKSSDESVITANSSAGASKINYQFAISQMAEPPKISIRMSPTVSGLQQFPPNVDGTSTLTINGKTINIEAADDVHSIVKKINGAFTDNDVKATYSEMTGELIISGKTTGASSKIEFSINDNKTDVYGKNLEGQVKDISGNVLRSLNEEKNTFSIDNIEYKAESTGQATLKSVTDTEKSTKNMKAFVDDYNKLMEKVYNLVTTKKNADFPPLTDKQKEEMTKEEIEKWEEKSKQGILKNDNDLRAFVEDVQQMFFGSIENIKALSKMGIDENGDRTTKGQIIFDEKKFAKALEEDSDLVYDTLAKYSANEDDKGMIEKLKTIVYDYSGSSVSRFGQKAGIEKTGSAYNNIYSKEIAERESRISRLMEKMNDKENKLYVKYSSLESVLNKYSSQMNYFSNLK